MMLCNKELFVSVIDSCKGQN